MKDFYKKESPILTLPSLAGGFQGGVGESDPWYITSGRQYEQFSSSSQVKLDSSRNIYITQGTSNSQVILKFKNDGTLVWKKRISQVDGGGNAALAIDNSGNVYVVCKTNYQYNSSTFGAHLVKFNSSGTYQWSRILDSKCSAGDITTDPSGNIYMCGSRTSQGQVSNGLYSSDLQTDIFCAKWNSSGTLLWQRKEVGKWDPNYLQRNIMSQYHEGFGITYVGAYDGTSYSGNTHPAGVIIAGRFQKYTTQASTIDFLLTRFDEDGNREWIRSYGVTQYGTVDADQPDDGVAGYQQCLISDSSGDVYCAGTYGGYNGYRSVVFKIRGDGTNIWQRRYGYTNDHGVALTLDTVNNNIIVVGYNNHPSTTANDYGLFQFYSPSTGGVAGNGGAAHYTTSTDSYSTFTAPNADARLTGVTADDKGFIYLVGSLDNVTGSAGGAINARPGAIVLYKLNADFGSTPASASFVGDNGGTNPYKWRITNRHSQSVPNDTYSGFGGADMSSRIDHAAMNSTNITHTDQTATDGTLIVTSPADWPG